MTQVRHTRRPVIAYHLVITCYGFWLPNDPRGSGSKKVWAEGLQSFGPATYVDARRSVARRPHDWQVRMEAKTKLKHPPVRFDGLQARAVARGFAVCLAHVGLDCLACAVLPEHSHLVVRRGAFPAESLMIDLKAAATHAMLEEGVHPFQAFAERDEKLPKAWGRSGRKVFLFDDGDIARSIAYVERNPSFDRLPRQRWSFVTPFDAQKKVRRERSER